jgi:serine/threonine protein kinase
MICRQCREEWRAVELSPEDFRSGRLMKEDSSSAAAQTALPDDLPEAGSSGSGSVVIDARWAGRTLGRYRVMSVLGSGGMAVVWRAHDDALRRDVALKILNQRESGNGHGGLNAELFMQEARAIAKLQHPSVVPIYEVAQDQGEVFLALELMEGGTLRQYVEHYGRIPPRELWSMMVQPAKALALAHRVGVIHRDIKPTNLMFDEHGHLKLMDFGLADVAREAASERLRGKAVGSLGWIAPETARGQSATPAGDIYGMGLVMLYALRGKSWLTAASKAEFMALHRNPPPLDTNGIKGLTPAGAALLRKCLAVEPAERFASAALLADALQECADQNAARQPRWRKSHVSVAVIAALVGGVLVAIGATQYFFHLIEQQDQLQRPAVARWNAARQEPSVPLPAVPPKAPDAPSWAPPDMAAPAATDRPRKPSEDLRRPWPEVYPDARFAFVGSTKSDVFHRADSDCGRSIFASNLVTYASVEEAAKGGRKSCPKCHPTDTAGPSAPVAPGVAAGPSDD